MKFNQRLNNIVKKWQFYLCILTLLGGPPTLRKGYLWIKTANTVINDYPRSRIEIQRNFVRMQVLMNLQKANMPDFDSVDYEVLYDGQYFDVDIKKALSGDIVIFTRDTSLILDVFWLFPQYDEEKLIFWDDKYKPRWVDKKQK